MSVRCLPVAYARTVGIGSTAIRFPVLRRYLLDPLRGSGVTEPTMVYGFTPQDVALSDHEHPRPWPFMDPDMTPLYVMIRRHATLEAACDHAAAVQLLSVPPRPKVSSAVCVTSQGAFSGLVQPMPEWSRTALGDMQLVMEYSDAMAGPAGPWETILAPDGSRMLRRDLVRLLDRPTALATPAAIGRVDDWLATL